MAHAKELKATRTDIYCQIIWKCTDVQLSAIKSYPAKPENDSIVLTGFLGPDLYSYDWMQQDSEAFRHSEKPFKFCLQKERSI